MFLTYLISPTDPDWGLDGYGFLVHNNLPVLHFSNECVWMVPNTFDVDGNTTLEAEDYDYNNHSKVDD